MKKIGIDARLINKTGVGVYIRNLIYYLEKKAPADLSFYIYLMRQDYPNFEFKNPNFKKVSTNAYWHTIQEQTNFAYELYRNNLDLMHFTYFSYPILYAKKFIATIHDLTPVYYKTGRASTKNPLVYELKHRLFKLVLSFEIRNAKVLITPCNTVKKQILKYFSNKYEDKIYPVYEGVNYELINTAENSTLKKQFDKDFFIYVGNFYPHKNIERLIEAFAKVNKDMQLILLGPDDFFSRRVFQLICELKQEKRIILYNNLKREDLVFFYKHAKALISPSLSEGFGLPLLEASYFNCPVIASDIDVFNEILGDNFTKFDPYKEDDIAEKINLLLTKNPQVDYKAINDKYSFEKMTNETLKLYLNELHI